MTDEDRPAGKIDVSEGWVCAYSLGLGTKFVAQVQKASLETEPFGGLAEPALFGSPEWWPMIEEGALPSQGRGGDAGAAGQFADGEQAAGRVDFRCA